MKLLLTGHGDRYALEQLQLALFPEETMEPVDAPFSGDGAVSALHRGARWLSAVTTIRLRGKTTRAVRRLAADKETVQLRRRVLQQSYYLAALAHLREAPAWGALAGVRPTKLTTACLLAGKTEKQADALLRDSYFVTPARRALALACSAASVRAARKAEATDVSVYVGIPFCPTRCAYCSFVSRGIGGQTELLEPYLQALLREIAYTGKLLESSAFKARTIYIGGGTPTTLSAHQLARLLDALARAFDLSRCIEFTVEGGRPDTLDAAKLAALRLHGADRVSINPQSMDDGVLRACGRAHSARDILRACSQARTAGFEAINMDLIAGLPTDTPDGFRRSLDAVAALRPENITVHTLALKKGAELFDRRTELPDAQQVGRMVRDSGEILRACGYQPYYLYRQKYMSGSFENVGWTLAGRECLYNIYMMEEMQTILSFGGGAMSKRVNPDGSLTRLHNPKFPEQYIERLDDVLARKRAFVERMKGDA